VKDYEIYFYIDKASGHYRALNVLWNVSKTTVFDSISPYEVSHRLAVEVAHSGAENVVTLRSDECVFNKTQVPIKVRLNNNIDKDDVVTETVDPGTFPHSLL
jgi:hypothetical protein